MQEIQKIAKKLQQIDKKVYIVWWWCRDKILWRKPWDIDLTTDATPSEMKKVLDVVWEIGSKYGTLIIFEWGKKFEITAFRKDIWTVNNRKPAEVEFTNSLEEDASRRDFTMNAIYYDVSLDEYIDPFWWIDDLLSWKIKFIGNPEDRLWEDILRLLRCVRFKNKYNLVLPEWYTEILKNNITLLNNISSFRIKDELDKMLVDKSNVKTIYDLRRINFIWEIFAYITISEVEKDFEKLNNAEIFDVDLYYCAIFIHTQFFEDYLSSLPFSNKSKKKIRKIIANFQSLYFFESLSKEEVGRLFIEDYIEDSLVLLGRYKIKEKYNDFKELLQYITLPTWSDIVKNFPELKWSEIRDKLTEEQNKILTWLV